MVKATTLFSACALACGCNLSPVSGTQGIDGGLGGHTGAGGTHGAGGGDAGPAVQCPRAFVVLDTDYMSTNVSVLKPDGTVLSPSIISTAAMPPGLSMALSGDVILPYASPASGDLVLIDQANNAIDWVDPMSGKVLAQASVATGFNADPTDYLEVSAKKAYVTRYDDNTTPGMQPNDAGGDILILDTSAHSVTGRIDLSDPDNGMLWARPNRMLSVGGQVWVLLERLDAMFMNAGDARVAGVDPTTDKRTFTVDLKGLQNCGASTLSPSGKVVAVSCSGNPSGTSNATSSAIVTLDATKNPPVEIKRYPVPATLGGSLAATVAFASETLLVGVDEGDSMAMPPRNDVAFTLDLTSGMATKLLDGGDAFVLGDVRCTPGCGDACVLADAKANVLHFWKVTGGMLVAGNTVNPDPSPGLQPRGLGEL
jgi:hypothetical protein